ncbi:uncharacterized protein LOC62_03G004296 [Vanrija pseudolonga]|uniref:Uncharacterized protein n=1 Tax=Vanrija pseudolonga TaxID=143232 RepID=A0AAF0YB86_9TREE|nr:hypothetical protein LOC62_03G004296 [Vanrija pseudolonga]
MDPERRPRTSTAETQSHSGGLTLPSEVLTDIIASVDPTTAQGRKALVTLLTVSSFFWEKASQVLYRDIQLDNDKLFTLLAAGRETSEDKASPHRFQQKLSERSARALGFIKRLEFLAPLSLDCLRIMFDEAGAKGATLFENVQQLRIISDTNTAVKQLAKDDPPDDIVLFNRPDVCLSGEDIPEYFRWLPLRGTRFLAHHGAFTADAMWWVPPSWESFKIFDACPAQFPAADPSVCIFWADEVRFNPNRTPIDVFLVMENDDEKAKIQRGIDINPDKPFPREELRLHFMTPREEAPPCPVCGETWPPDSYWLERGSDRED